MNRGRVVWEAISVAAIGSRFRSRSSLPGNRCDRPQMSLLRLDVGNTKLS